MTGSHCAGCASLDKLTISGEEVAGCVEVLPVGGEWGTEWTRLDRVKRCPKVPAQNRRR